MAGLLDQLMQAQLPQSGSGLLGQIPGLPPLANDTAAPTALPQAANAYLQWRQNNLNAPVWQQAFGMMTGPVGAEGMAGRGILAYHGSPYDFNAFDLRKIGSGEGAQAYGHGLYFAENPNVASSYKMTQPTGGSIPIPPDVQNAIDQLGRLGFDSRQQALNAIRTHFDWRNQFDVHSPRDQALADVVDRFTQANPRGKLYEVNIAASPSQLLDWDKPLRAQPSQVQDALSQIPNVANRIGPIERVTGKTYNPPAPRLYRDVSLFPQDASQQLQKVGIPGIQYLDQGSRAAGNGTRNYVIFNPNLVTILRKYGLGGLLAGGGAAAAGQQPSQ